MRFGINSYSSIPFAASLLDESIQPAIVDLIADQEAQRSYLFLATPYDPVGAAEVDVRASIALKYPILDSEHWPAILKTAADSQVDLFGEDESSQGRTSFGNIELMIGDADHDELVDYFWDGRAVEVMLGAEDFAFEEYTRVLFGAAEDITFGQRKLGIVFRGKEDLLDKPVQETLYTGAGGLEGGEDLADSEKPLAYGVVRNLTPILVDRVNLVYQCHDGAIRAVTAALDGGAALTSVGDVADITAETPAAGFYITQLSGGYIKLGAPTVKGLTIDIEGANSGGYVETATDIIEHIVLNHADLTADDLNQPSFFTARLDSNRAPCGLYITGESVQEVITDLMQSVGGAWTFNRLGLLTLNVLRKRSSSGTVHADDVVKDSFKRERTVPPSWQRRIGYGKSWTVQTEDQLIDSATDTQKDFAVNEYRFVSHETASIKTRRAGARVVKKETLLTNKADATTEVERQQLVYGDDFDRINITTRRQQFKYTVGQTITLEYPRFGIDKDMIIIGLRENTSSKRTTFRLWG